MENTVPWTPTTFTSTSGDCPFWLRQRAETRVWCAKTPLRSYVKATVGRFWLVVLAGRGAMAKFFGVLLWYLYTTCDVAQTKNKKMHTAVKVHDNTIQDTFHPHQCSDFLQKVFTPHAPEKVKRMASK